MATTYATCSACGGENGRSHRWCRECFAAYMREWRQHHHLAGAALARARARAHANIYRRRGHLRAEPCEVCGSADVEMHHDDYGKPLEVRWLCAAHHREHTNATVPTGRAASVRRPRHPRPT